jgi:hypothetical protein
LKLRAPLTTAAAACAIGAALLAGGCRSAASTGPAASSVESTQSSSADTAGAPSAPASSGGNASGSGSGGSAAGTACQASNLTFALGATSGAGQITQPVNMTNSGSAACTMDGFPGVDLVGVANGQENYTWPLVRSSASYAKVTLQPGATAHFDLLYLPAGSGTSTAMTVLKLELTPPNTFTQAQVTWNRSVLLQDGATHPGTYITPVVAGAA